MVPRFLVTKHPAARGCEKRVERFPDLDEIRGVYGDCVDALEMRERGCDASENPEVVEGEQIRRGVLLDGLSEGGGKALRSNAFDPNRQSRSSGKHAELRRNRRVRFFCGIRGPDLPDEDLTAFRRAREQRRKDEATQRDS